MPTIHEQVAAKLAGISPAVTEKIVDNLVEKEVASRVSRIEQGLAKLSELEKEQRKLSKPDIQVYTDPSKPATSQFSKERVESIQKVEQKIEKLTKALDKAIDAADFSDLNNVVNNKGD